MLLSVWPLKNDPTRNPSKGVISSEQDTVDAKRVRDHSLHCLLTLWEEPSKLGANKRHASRSQQSKENPCWSQLQPMSRNLDPGERNH
ncbi:hypothetical protein GX50_01498 [[Emmonsia] crescens]|uniref:Uncharacterized protein n=1 Tax=[Emmonsia] crescens TaxID=73230 RepID=A0A2B7ZQS2_9EURO|nr:hypothetical protein GX50_01498 [Emmonsia crescens]